MNWGTLRRTIVTSDSLSLHPQEQVQTLPYKETHPEMLLTSLGPTSTEMDWYKVEKRASPHFKLFLEVIDILSSELKMKRTIQIVQKPTAVMVGVVFALFVGITCEGTINAERDIYDLEHMLPSRQYQFQGCLGKTMPRHSADVTTVWLRSKRETKRVARLNSRPVSHWESVAHYETQNMTTEPPDCWATELVVLSSQTWSVAKRKGDVTKW